MYSIEGIELTKIEQEFVENCNRFGWETLGIPDLSPAMVEIIKTAVLKPYSINRTRISLYLDMFDSEERKLYLGKPMKITLEDLEPIFRRTRADIVVDYWVNYYGNREYSGFLPTDEAITASFPSFPRLALNVATQPENGIVTRKMYNNLPTAQQIMDRKSPVTRLELVAKLSTEEIMTEAFKWGIA